MYVRFFFFIINSFVLFTDRRCTDEGNSLINSSPSYERNTVFLTLYVFNVFHLSSFLVCWFILFIDAVLLVKNSNLPRQE